MAHTGPQLQPRRWGPNADERFQFGGVNPIPTASFDAVKKATAILRTDQISLFVKYTRGTEAGLQMRIDFATPEDHPDDATAFFEETFVDLSNNRVKLFRPILTATGFFRLPLPVVITERILRVSLATAGGAFSGSGEIWYTTGNLRSPLAAITVP